MRPIRISISSNRFLESPFEYPCCFSLEYHRTVIAGRDRRVPVGQCGGFLSGNVARGPRHHANGAGSPHYDPTWFCGLERYRDVGVLGEIFSSGVVAVARLDGGCLGHRHNREVATDE